MQSVPFPARALSAAAVLFAGGYALSSVATRAQYKAGEVLRRQVSNLSASVAADEVWGYCLERLQPLSKAGPDAEYLFRQLVDVVNSIHQRWIWSETQETSSDPLYAASMEQDMLTLEHSLKERVHMLLRASGAPAIHLPVLGDDAVICDLPVDSDLRSVVLELLHYANQLTRNTVLALSESVHTKPFDMPDYNDMVQQVMQRNGLTEQDLFAQQLPIR